MSEYYDTVSEKQGGGHYGRRHCLKSSFHVSKLLSKLINNILRDEMDRTKYRDAVYGLSILGSILKNIEIEKLEERLKSIEDRVNAR